MATKRVTKKPEQRPLQIAYVGNFGAEHSTENHVARALEFNGHSVTRFQENSPRWWVMVTRDQEAFDTDFDLVLWTRTGWNYTAYGYANQDEALGAQWHFLQQMRRKGVPVAGYHLDLFHGLNPEREAIVDEPFFAADLVITADGGSQEWFASKMVNHHWMPPGVSAPECEPGMFRDEFHSTLAFVGSWQGHYHPESKHRFELVRWLQENFRRDCKFWPEEGRPAIRGADLRDLYASVDIVVGDSCLVGTGHANYWSDRIPETLGRGGLLLHPEVAGLRPAFQEQSAVNGCPGLPWTWEAFEWDQLGSLIETTLGMSAEARHAAAAWTRQYVLRYHTYEVRMRQLVELLYEKGLLK